MELTVELVGGPQDGRVLQVAESCAYVMAARWEGRRVAFDRYLMRTLHEEVDHADFTETIVP